MCQSSSMPFFGQLCSSCLKEARRTEVYVHTSRLHEKILAARSDLVSTHRGKEVVLVLNKDPGEALNIACNTESVKSRSYHCSDVESAPREIKNNSSWISSTNFKNINKFHTDCTVCDKAIRSQLIS